MADIRQICYGMDASPDSVVARILQSLQPRDLARCMCVNRQWRALIPALPCWAKLVQTSWEYWEDKWQPLQTAGLWKQIHDKRLQARSQHECDALCTPRICSFTSACVLHSQADSRAEALLARTVWPLERHRCLVELRAMGSDALVRMAPIAQSVRMQQTARATGSDIETDLGSWHEGLGISHLRQQDSGCRLRHRDASRSRQSSTHSDG